nr:hypothetical protein [Tanacetum cinerariifolium]
MATLSCWLIHRHVGAAPSDDGFCEAHCSATKTPGSLPDKILASKTIRAASVSWCRA